VAEHARAQEGVLDGGGGDGSAGGVGWWCGGVGGAWGAVEAGCDDGGRAERGGLVGVVALSVEAVVGGGFGDKGVLGG